MGMFDDIIVPKSYLRGLLSKKEEKILKTGCRFQTKDLGNVLSTYKVYKQKLYINDRTLWNCEPPDTEQRNESTSKKYPYEKGRWQETRYTGAVVFYNTFKDEKLNEWWFEFEFTFNNGRLDKKDLVSCKLETTKAKKDSVDKMWDTEQEIFDEYRENFKYRFFSWLERRFQKMTNWARKKHGIPLEIRKEAYEKSGRLKKDPQALDLYADQ
jgi:hypothetical protein|tara:strand:+ start:70 stop:705 length:636 start_codon:yes stop_codon:yes gene_type:complete